MNRPIKSNIIILLLLQSTLTISQTPCENGVAGDYPCNGIDLMSHISAQTLLAEELSGSWLNDIWGWTDSDTGKEYALIGMTNGTSFVDVSDPVNPIFLGILNEHNFAGKSNEAKSVWRDINVYNNYAFIVSEDENQGMQVFDLTELRGVTSPQTFSETTNYQGISNAHNVVINETTGFAYIVGATKATTGNDCADGGLHIIDISTPDTPVYRACYDEDGYTHDAQCIIYNGPDEDYQGKEICFNANEDTIIFVDVDDKDAIVQISRTGYSGAQYTHQGWLTEDHKYFLTNDELDEYRDGTNTKTLIWDVQDLDTPVLIGTYEHAGKAIDHNLYISGDFAYESNYTSGLRVLDIIDVAEGTLSEVAFFDTYLSSDAAIFDGNWSNYPFFKSGTIIISDITNGLFVLKMQQGLITHQPKDVYACVDQHLDIPMSIAGVGFSYQWQIDDGSGFKDIDDFERYKNTTTSVMQAQSLKNEQTGLKFRCIATDEDNIQYLTDAATLTVSDIPESIFTYTIEDNLVTFSNSSLRAENYEWGFGDESEINTEENPIHEYMTNAEYQVLLKTSNECGSNEITQNINLSVTGLADEGEFTSMTLYPNPTKDIFNIHFSKPTTHEVGVTLRGSHGKTILQYDIPTGSSKFIVDHQSIECGMYYMTLQSEKREITKKVFIE